MIVKLKHNEYGEIMTIDNVSIYELLMVDDPKGAVTMHWITKTDGAGHIVSRCGWDCDNWDLFSVINDYDVDDPDPDECCIPEDFYHPRYVLFQVRSPRSDIEVCMTFLDDLCVPYACGIHSTSLGDHAHFIMNWQNLTRHNRVNLRTILEDNYQASNFSKCQFDADLQYLQSGCADESDFINHLNKEEN